jgi:hypothetical protein
MANKWFGGGLRFGPFDTSYHLNGALGAVLINSTGDASLQFDTHRFLSEVQATWRSTGSLVTISTGFTIVGASDHVNFGSGSQLLTFSSPAGGGGQLAKGIVVFESGSAEGDSNLICYCSFKESIAPDPGLDRQPIKVRLDAAGFARASY